MMAMKLKRGPNHALQRTRPVCCSCNRGVSLAGSLSLGRSASRRMIELTSLAWKNFKVPEGSATEVPAKILAFRSAPSLDTFDELWDTLTGVGDIQITNAFWPALLHILDPVLKLHQADRELAIGQIGWGIALASSERTVSEESSHSVAKKTNCQGRT